MATPLLPIQRPRKNTTSSSSRQCSLTSSQTTSTNTSFEAKQGNEQTKEVPVWLSVFFGRPDPTAPELDHARFNARVPEEIWKPKHRSFTSNADRILFDTKEANRLSAQQSVHLRNPEARLPIFFATGKQATRFTEEILACQKGPCRMCRKVKPGYIMFRPLGATQGGYMELSDFDKMHHLMSTVASHTAHFTRRAEVDWSIGTFMSDRPYMCCLAVPICSVGENCHRSALLCSQGYITGILDGKIKPHAMKEDFKSPSHSVNSPALSRSFASTECDDDTHTPASSFGSIRNPFRRRNKLRTIGTTVFVGRPDLRIRDRPQRGQLSCLVLSSSWPSNMLPGQSKNEADDAWDYCRIAGYHERHILETADYRCAICSEVIPARYLVHRPISFARTGKQGLQDGRLRRALMILAQYAKGRWTFPDMEAFFGDHTDAQVFDFAVPICEPKTICEEVARTAAREFIKLFLPRDMKLAFPGLDPDTDLSMLEFDDDNNNNSYWGGQEQDSPELLVRKIAPRALMTESGDRGEDPMDCALSVTKLRHWYELCFEEEVAKRDYLKQIGYKRTGDESDSDSESSDVDDSVVWVYVRDDEGEATDNTNNNNNSSRNVRLRQEQLERDAVVQKLGNQVLFSPMLNFEFWLLCEAVGGEEALYGDDEVEIESQDSDSTVQN